jgi:hypothetical protein
VYRVFLLCNEGTRRMTPTTAKLYLTTDEVADMLRAPAETVRYWRHIGKGPKCFKLGRRVLYAVEDVQTFIETARKAGTAA